MLAGKHWWNIFPVSFLFELVSSFSASEYSQTLMGSDLLRSRVDLSDLDGEFQHQAQLRSRVRGPFSFGHLSREIEITI